MATRKHAAKKTISKTIKSDSRTELASKAVSAIMAAITQSKNGLSSNVTDPKMTINVHIGDIILLGFDEAIDAEEWGMRENNTEIISDMAGKEKARQSANTDALTDENRKISRSIKLKKGSLELIANENSNPAKKSSRAKRLIKKASATKRPSRRKAS